MVGVPGFRVKGGHKPWEIGQVKRLKDVGRYPLVKFVAVRYTSSSSAPENLSAAATVGNRPAG